MSQTESITLGGGCFWCLEVIFQEIKGVIQVESGYADGHLVNPTYQDVLTGTTGHAEVVQLTYDSQIISFQEILEIFFSIHDPTTPNRQGHDIGSQYRSIILYHTREQKQIAERFIRQLNLEKIWNAPIVTQVKPLKVFYKAEEYHQQYFNRNPDKPYCRLVIAPKLGKMHNTFKTKLKTDKNRSQ